MKFDLFDAIRAMCEMFGESSEVRVSHYDGGVRVVLQVFKNGQWHSEGFAIPFKEINDANVLLMNLKFKRGMHRLELYLKELDS